MSELLTPGLRRRLTEIEARYDELARSASDAATASDPNRIREIGRELASLEIVVETVIPTYADPDFLWSFFHSKSLWGKNLKLHDQQMDDWLDKARQSTDQAERKQLYIDVQKRLMETVPMVFLMTREQADEGATRAIVRHLHTAGPVVRLELERQDGGGVVEAELSRERYRELHLEVGEQVFIRPRNLRVFLEDYAI